jgi:hypothetical protein
VKLSGFEIGPSARHQLREILLQSGRRFWYRLPVSIRGSN